MREVPRVRDDLHPCGGGERAGVAGVLDRDDHVVATPHDQHRHRLGEVGAIDHGDDLALEVDDGADDVPDRGPGARIGEGLVDVGDLTEVAGGRTVEALECVHAGLAEVAYARERQRAHHLLVAGQRDGADDRGDLGPEATG